MEVWSAPRPGHFPRERHGIQWFLVNEQLDAQSFSMYLFQFSTCFEQPRTHNQENQLHQYNLWYMSFCVGDRFTCRSDYAKFFQVVSFLHVPSRCTFHANKNTDKEKEATRVKSMSSFFFVWTSDLLKSLPCYIGASGGVVVKALLYKPAGRGFYSRWCHWNFSVT